MRMQLIPFVAILAATLTQAAPAPIYKPKPKEKDTPAPTKRANDDLPADLRRSMNGFDSWFPKMLQSARIDLRDAKTEKEQKRYRKAIAIMQEESYTVPISVLKAALKAQDRQTAAIQTAIHNAIREYEARYETAKKQGLVE